LAFTAAFITCAKKDFRPPPVTRSTITDAFGTRAEVGNIVAAHANDVVARSLERNLGRGAVA
jgi:hypothetical protein